MKTWAARALLGLLWLLHWLPLSMLAPLGWGLGRLLHAVAGRRRRIALRNTALCLPDWPPARRNALVREHFGWLGRSLLERGLLLYGSPERLKRLIHVEGDVGLADRSNQPVMWLVPHFLGLDVAGVSTQLYQKTKVGGIYQAQSNPVLDAAMRKGRLRFGNAAAFARQETALPMVRAIRRGMGFFNLPDMDFGPKDAAFIPFFGVPAATLLAPSRMALSLNMLVQPVVTQMLPGGRGYVVRFLPAWTDWPSKDAEGDALRMNQWIEGEITQCPAQYLWVHKRFKTRPPGENGFYE